MDERNHPATDGLKLLPIKEAAKRLGVSEWCMRNLVRAEGFPALTVGRRLMVRESALLGWMEAQEREGGGRVHERK